MLDVPQEAKCSLFQQMCIVLFSSYSATLCAGFYPLFIANALAAVVALLVGFSHCAALAKVNLQVT